MKYSWPQFAALVIVWLAVALVLLVADVIRH